MELGIGGGVRESERGDGWGYWWEERGRRGGWGRWRRGVRPFAKIGERLKREQRCRTGRRSEAGRLARDRRPRRATPVARANPPPPEGSEPPPAQASEPPAALDDAVAAPGSGWMNRKIGTASHQCPRQWRKLPGSEDQQPPEAPAETEELTAEREPAPVAKLDDLKAVLAKADADFRPAAYPRRNGWAGITHRASGWPALALLVHAGDTLHFANREFFKLTGHESLEAIAAAGGLDALFADGGGSEPGGPAGGTLSLRRAERGPHGRSPPHLHSIAWNGGKALMLALQPVTEPQAAASEDEDELRDRLYELRAIVDTATDGVILIDKDGFIRSISRPAEALFGMDSKQVEGKSFTTLFAIDSQRSAGRLSGGPGRQRRLAASLNDGREVIGRRRRRGRFIPLFHDHWAACPPTSGYCAVLRDITNWKRAEVGTPDPGPPPRPNGRSFQKTGFLARVSHEVRHAAQCHHRIFRTDARREVGPDRQLSRYLATICPRHQPLRAITCSTLVNVSARHLQDRGR